MGSEWRNYSERCEWKDVAPVDLSEGPHPVVQIAYSDKFKDVFGYFRAVVKSGEKSERVLSLTADAAELNPANYTVWQYRRTILKSLNKDMKEELSFIRSMIEEHPKNYQVWHHRKAVVDSLQDGSRELRLCEIMLSEDPKNYHAWQHRQMIVREYNLFAGELEFVDRLLEDDIRNNSAWNHRYFIINNTSKFMPEVMKTEIEYCKKAILKATNNEAVWNYMKGVLYYYEPGISKYPGLDSFCEELYNNGCMSRHLLGFIIDKTSDSIEENDEQKTTKLKRIEELCDTLAKEDTIRSEYWKYIKHATLRKHGVADGGGDK